MKKLLLISTLLFSSGSALAADSFYLGAEATQNKIGYKKVSSVRLADGSSFNINSNDYYNDSATGFGIFAGKEFKRFDVELGYNYLSTDKTNNNTGLVVVPGNTALQTKSQIKLHLVSVDFKPTFKINDFSFYPIIGATLARANIDESFLTTGREISHASVSKNKLGFDIGVGAKLQITEKLFARIQAKYTRIDLSSSNLSGINGLDYVATASVGLGYSF